VSIPRVGHQVREVIRVDLDQRTLQLGHAVLYRVFIRGIFHAGHSQNEPPATSGRSGEGPSTGTISQPVTDIGKGRVDIGKQH